MDEKELLKAKEEMDAKVLEIASQARTGDILSAQCVTELLNEPYDAEVSCPDVISEIAEVKRVEMGKSVQYYVQDATVKTVYTVTDGSVTQVNVSPSSPSTLSFSDYSAPEDYLYIPDMLSQKYNSLAKKAKDQHEALNRKEQKDFIALLFASAESESNTFANTSGDDKIDYKKLVEIVRSLAKYGKSKFVLVSGSAVTTDLVLMDYDDDKNREVSVEKSGISKWIKVENYTYTHSTSQTVMPTDRAIVVATSDAEDNRPALFARRKIEGIVGVDSKERLTVADGPRIQVGDTPKWGFAISTFEEYGAVVVNPKCIAVYQDASSYTNL